MSGTVCILGTANLKHMTLITLYTEELKRAGQAFDIIYIDKYHKEEASDAQTLYRYELNLKEEWPFYRKLIHYWSFRKFAIDIIQKKKYKFIIVWNEFTALMFSDFLKRRYPGRYCVNIRDENFNGNPLVQHRYKQAVSKSCFSTISSERFREIFPKADYLFIHSYNDAIIKDLKPVEGKREDGQKIRIMFIGRASYPETIYKTIDAIGGDPRFELWLIGMRCNMFLPYVEEKALSNVVIHDSFPPAETAKFLASADIIYSLNKENEAHSDTLLPIKLYYAIGRHIPILAFTSSFTYEYAKRFGIEIGVTGGDFKNLGDLIFTKYRSMDQQSIAAGCNAALEEICGTNRELKRRIDLHILKD